MSAEIVNIHHYQERRLGRTLLKTYRTMLDLDDLEPNPKQPRMGPKEDEELQRQIEANEGIFEPLLVEPHPELAGKFRIIDGDRRWSNSRVLVETLPTSLTRSSSRHRRWSNSRVLVETQKKEHYRKLPVEITDRTLTDEERFRVWIYIHRQRKEWDAKEKEMVAYNLVNLVGRASAANILGITVRELDKLVEIYSLSGKLTNLPDPAASITWAREIKNISKKLLTPSILDTIIRRVNDKEITNSKDIRKLRQVLKDPVAREAFMSKSGSIEAALQKVLPAPTKKGQGLVGEIDELNEALRRYPWVTLAELKGDPQVIRKLEETEKLLKELKKALSR